MNTHYTRHHNLGQVKTHLPFASQQQMLETTCSLARHSSGSDHSIVTGSTILTPREGERNRSLTSYLIFQCRGLFSDRLADLPVGEGQVAHTWAFASTVSPTTTALCQAHLTNPSPRCTIRPDPKRRREESVADRFISSFSFYARSILQPVTLSTQQSKDSQLGLPSVALFSVNKWPYFRLSKFKRDNPNGPVFGKQVALFSLDKNTMHETSTL